MGVKSKIAEYLAANANASVQGAVDLFVMAHRDTRMLSVAGIEKSDDEKSIDLRVVSNVTGLSMKFNVTVENEAPYKIAKFELEFVDGDIGEKGKISLNEARRELDTFFIKVCQDDGTFVREWNNSPRENFAAIGFNGEMKIKDKGGFFLLMGMAAYRNYKDPFLF